MKTKLLVLFFAIVSIAVGQTTTGLFISASSGSIVGQGIVGYSTGGMGGDSYDGRLKVGAFNYSTLSGDPMALWGITVDFSTTAPVFGQTYAVNNFQTSTFDTVGQQKPALNIESFQYDSFGGHWVSPDFVTGTFRVLEYTTDGSGNLLSGAIDAIQYENSSSEYTFVSWRLNSSYEFTTSAIPESSTYAVIAGTAMLGLAFWKRRKPAS